MQELQIFTYNNNQLRTVNINGITWWVLKDVCDILDLKNPTHVANRLEDDELTTFNVGGKSGVSNIINESGLYNVILRSDKPQAKPFRKWVTGEVLPSIRKTGTYTVKANDKSKSLQIKEMNARTRMSNQFLKLANVETLSKEYKNILVSKATEILTGTQLIPLPKSVQKTYSATELGEMFGVTSKRIRIISNEHKLKTDEYGEWYRNKSKYSNRECDTFVYNDSVIPVLKNILGEM